MKVDLTIPDLIRLVKGTGGPNTYPSSNSYVSKSGTLHGFPNEHWQWNEAYLKSLMETQLWDLYQALLR